MIIRALRPLASLCLYGCVHAAPSPTTPAEQRDLAARSSLRATPSGQRFIALIDAVNAGDTAAILRLAQNEYLESELAQSGGRPRLLNRWLEIHETVGPIRIDSIMDASAGSINAWVRGSTSQTWLTFRLAVDSAATNRIVRVGLGRGLRPPYAASRNPRLTDAELGSKIGAYIESLASSDLFSGVVLVARGDAPFITRTVGYADRATGKPMRLDTPFDLASIGKTFTVVAIGRLLDQGKLHLDDTVARYVPELPAAIGQRITIAQLLEHSSGLGELGPTLDSAMRSAKSVREMISRFTDTSLTFAPGTRFQYSNRGYVVLGAVVEAVSGLRYEDYISREVLQRAGMTRSGIFQLTNSPSNRAHRYSHYKSLRTAYAPGPRTEFQPIDDLAPGPHGGAYSTAEDMLRFSVALQNGTLVSPATLRLLIEPRAGHPWGKGFEIAGEGRAISFGHAGASPGTNTLFRVFPNAGYTLVVLSNIDGGANVAGAYITELLEAAAR